MAKADIESSSISLWILRHVLFILALTEIVACNEDAKRLLEELFDGYSPIARPVADENDIITLKLGLKLSQIADIDEKNQIMTTNVWLRHEWSDYKLTWNPQMYGNTTKINIPSSDIWLPDVVLYNNADGDYQITTKTKATIHYDGKIIWEPPMIYKSYCAINIEYYPFDIQDCYMKFGTWTFDGTLINMHHVTKNDSLEEIIPNKNQVGLGSVKMYTVEMGIDLSDYYQSVEWDILSIPAQKNIKYYDCCDGPYYDIYFNITIRRKTLFYTVNLIIPCVNISFLSVLVFYLPSDSGEKLTLGISILVALLVFYLLLIDLIPPTSLVIPLLGKYLLFTLVLVNLSILLTIFVLNLHHRKPNTHKMPHWMKVVFIDFLPKYLFMERPKPEKNKLNDNVDYEDIRTKMNLQYYHQPFVPNTSCLSDQQLAESENFLLRLKRKLTFGKSSRDRSAAFEVEANHSLYLKQTAAAVAASESMMKNCSSESPLPKMLKPKTNDNRYPESIRKALRGIKYLNKQTKIDSADRKEIDDWKYVSMVIDRLLLYVFTTACLIGTFGILLQAPSIYDERQELKKPPTLTYN